jgi:hypothetical protein
LILAGVAAVGIVGAALNDGSGDAGSAGGTAAGLVAGDADSEGSGDGEAAPAPAAPEPAAPGVGEPAADGKFQFVVNGLDCSQNQLGNEYLNQQAQGTFCIVDVTITNIGNESQSFFGDNAYLFNAQGQKFSADNEAAIYLDDSSSLYEEINPGNTLQSRIVFDVPVGVAPTAIELHDSAFSGGVTVTLQ